MAAPRNRSYEGFSVCSAVLACACDSFAPLEQTDPTPSPTDLAFFRPQLEMGVEPGLELCGGSLDYAERFIELYTQGSRDGEIDTPVEYYYLHPDSIRENKICGPGAQACTRAGVVYAPSPIHSHELVHAVRQIQHGGVLPGTRFFEEGLAQRDFPIDAGWDDSFSVLDLPAHVGEEMPISLYDPAAQVLSVVSAEQSDVLVETLVDASGSIETGSDVGPVILEVLGIDLEQLAERYDTYPECSAGARGRLLVECASAPEPWIEATWASAPYMFQGIGEFTCEDPRVIGPLDGRLWVFYTLDVPTDGDYELVVDSEPGHRLQMTQCDQPCGADIDLRWDDAKRREDITLSAGRHVLRLSRPLGDERGVGFQLLGPLP